MQLGTARDRSKAGDRVRVVVVPFTAMAVARPDISVGTIPSYRMVRTRAVERQASQARTGVSPPHQGCMSSLRTQMRLDRSRRSLVKLLTYSFQFNRIAW